MTFGFQSIQSIKTHMVNIESGVVECHDLPKPRHHVDEGPQQPWSLADGSYSRCIEKARVKTCADRQPLEMWIYFLCEVLSKELSKKIVNIGWGPGFMQHVEKKQSESDCGDIGKQNIDRIFVC